MERLKNVEVQMSESLLVGSLLAISGGFMDAYTYICRGGVFANAQTGNMVLIGIHLFKGDWIMSLRYMFPVVFFMAGIFISYMLGFYLKNYQRVHWRQIAVAFEIVAVAAVGFMGQDLNFIANGLISFCCGIQFQSFRKIRGNNLATTMCTGNLRSATELMCNYWHSGEKELLRKSFVYYGAIGVFIIGAALGNFVTLIAGVKAILVDALILVVVFILMLVKIKDDKLEQQN